MSLMPSQLNVRHVYTSWNASWKLKISIDNPRNYQKQVNDIDDYRLQNDDHFALSLWPDSYFLGKHITDSLWYIPKT